MPSASNIQGVLHVDQFLTDYSVSWVQDQANFVSTVATSIIPVQKSSDKYVTYDRGYFWRDDVAPRPLGGTPVQTGYKISSQNYNAEEYALEHFIDDRQRTNADAPINLELNATRLLTQKHMIKRDRVWATKFFQPSVWTNEYDGVASGVGSDEFLQWNDANSTPIEDVDTFKVEMMRKTGFKPNTLVLGADVYTKLRSNPDIRDVLKYTGYGDRALGSLNALAQIFEVDNVRVAAGVYNAAAEGAADDFQFITDTKSAWLGYIDPNPSLDSPTAIATFAWTGLIPGVTNALGGVIERSREDRAHSDFFQARQAWAMEQVSADLGIFLHDAVS